MLTWAPPRGSRELPDEPGWWQTPTGAIYAHPDATEHTQAEKDKAREYAREDATQRTRQDALRVPGLIDRIQDLEVSVFLTEQFLEAALLMLNEAREQEAFLEDLICGLLVEAKP